MGQAKYKICKLNKVAWFQEGPGVRKSQFRTSGVKLLNVRNICDRKLVLDKTSIYISEEEAYGKYKHFLIDEGDLLIASSGIKVDYFDKKITFAKKEHLPLCMNTSTIRFKVLDETQLDIHYLRHFLASRYFTRQVQFYITGSAQLNFGPSHLNEMTIILPSLVEQKKIAKILDKADEIRIKKKQANEKLDEFLKSTFVDMFGNPVKNEKHYKQIALAEIGKFKNGINFNSDDNGYTIKCIGVGDFKNNIMLNCVNNIKNVELNQQPSEEYFLRKNDIIFVRSNGSKELVGRTLLINTDLSESVVYSGFCIRLRVGRENINNMFLLELLNTKPIKENMKNDGHGCNIKSLNQSILGNIPVILPPIEEQNKFAQIVEKVEEQKQKNEEVIRQMDNLFNSLSQQAFKGELQ